MPVITVYDEKLGHQNAKTKAMTLDCLTENMTVRELIRARIYEEVMAYNQSQELKTAPTPPKLLVTPTELEQQLNAKDSSNSRMNRKKRKKVEWEKQFELALTSFEQNGFFVLVGDRQMEKLDAVIQVKVDTEVSFIKLTPLVGG